MSQLLSTTSGTGQQVAQLHDRYNDDDPLRDAVLPSCNVVFFRQLNQLHSLNLFVLLVSTQFLRTFALYSLCTLLIPRPLCPGLPPSLLFLVAHRFAARPNSITTI
jgi:hypothetical protein